MRTRPPGVDDDDLVTAASESWGLVPIESWYVPKGFGSYHWRLSCAGYNDVFVTVDDLDTKPWLGRDRDEAFEGLRTAFETAVRLRAAGCSFVVAPLPTMMGRPLERFTSRYSMAVFPYVHGPVGTFDQPLDERERIQLETLLADLHRATPAVATTALRRELAIPGRVHLDAALATLDDRWAAGPLGEAARQALARTAGTVRDWLSTFAERAQQLSQSRPALVITHGEPHAANTLRTTGGLKLVDWDTVALAPPERDLWMLDDGSAETFGAYTAMTGAQINRAAIEFYRLAWTLTDLATFAAVLRAPHDDNADTRKALAAFTSYLT